MRILVVCYLLKPKLIARLAMNGGKPAKTSKTQMYIFGAGANWNIIWSLRSWKCPWRSGALVGFALLFLVLACTLTLWPLRGAVNIFVSFAGDYTAGGKLSLKLKRPCKVRGGWSCRCVLFVKKKSRDDGDACSLHNWLPTANFCRLQRDWNRMRAWQVKRPEVLSGFICEREAR